MSLYYITGISGSGKSAVRNELLTRGYKAYGTDEDDLAYFYHNHTGERVANSMPIEQRTPEWSAQHSWKLSRAAIERLAHESDDDVFLCGVTSNDTDEIWDLFARVFALSITKETLIHRITTRTSNDFGKAPHEMASIVGWQDTVRDHFEKHGASIVDATRPLNQVVDEILDSVKK